MHLNHVLSPLSQKPLVWNFAEATTLIGPRPQNFVKPSRSSLSCEAKKYRRPSPTQEFHLLRRHNTQTATMASPQIVQCFGKKKSATAVAQCKVSLGSRAWHLSGKMGRGKKC